MQISLGIGATLALLLALFAAYAVGHRSGRDTSQAAQAVEGSVVIATPSPVPTPDCGLGAINRSLRSVVRVDTGSGTTGSGFFIDPSTVVTAAHVVAGVSSVQLQLADGTNANGIVSSSRALDLAVIRTPRPQPVVGLRWRDTSSVQAAEPVLGIGYPLGTTGTPTVTRGTVSRVYMDPTGVTYIQTDAGINPGNSGGPLIDECGKVLGIVDLRRTDAEAIALAISAKSAELEISRLSATSPQPPSLQAGILVPPYPGGPAAGLPSGPTPAQGSLSAPTPDLAIGISGGICPPAGSRLELTLTNAGSTPITERRIRVAVTAADGTVLWQNANQTISLDAGASIRQSTTALSLPPRTTARVDFLDAPGDLNIGNNSVVCSY